MAVELTKLAIGQTVSKKLGGSKISDGYLSLYDRESNTMGDSPTLSARIMCRMFQTRKA